MKERPILFSAPMVRAIMDGSKTQTRRVVSPRPHPDWLLKSCGILTCEAHSLHAQQVAVFDRLDGFNVPYKCPYGMPGDQLWVRETFSGPHCMESSDGRAAVPPSKWGRSSRIWYWADGNPTDGDWTMPRPSIHMPRWASRIQLEITGIRVERLQDISEADAIAEGIKPYSDGTYRDYHVPEDKVFDHYTFASPVDSYRTLWESINGAGSWDANPWVWVIEFRRIKP